LQVVRLIAKDRDYSERYAALFGALPPLPATLQTASPLGNAEATANWQRLSLAQQGSINQAFANVGKSIAAYQRKLLPGPSRFDKYADQVNSESGISGNGVLSREEIAGLKLFIGDGQCISCHNGPLFTNFEFHNTGVLAIAGQLPPMGRYNGIRLAKEDEFNCLSYYSDAQPEECIELLFAKGDNELVGAQKTPSLRNITETAPYMHGGQIADLTAVMEHYNDAPTSMLSHNEAKPLGLRPVQLSQLVAFMQTLTAPLNVDPGWLVAPSQ
jgi:cytochrome c peroxidase